MLLVQAVFDIEKRTHFKHLPVACCFCFFGMDCRVEDDLIVQGVRIQLIEDLEKLSWWL